LTVVGCDNGSTGSKSSFVGEWSGTATLSGQSAPATLSVTASGWTFAVPQAGINESGTYTTSGAVATLKSDGITVGKATISGSSMTVTLTAGSFAGGTAALTKISSGGSEGGGVAAEWQGTYQPRGSYTSSSLVYITGNTAEFAGIKHTGMSTRGGGNYSGDFITGKWVYLYQDNYKVGVFVSENYVEYDGGIIQLYTGKLTVEANYDSFLHPQGIVLVADDITSEAPEYSGDKQ
jgi:hypothetical protein